MQRRQSPWVNVQDTQKQDHGQDTHDNHTTKGEALIAEEGDGAALHNGVGNGDRAVARGRTGRGAQHWR